MPRIERQTPPAAKKPTPPQNQGVLDRVAPIKLGSKGTTIVEYGRSGTGKTTLACTGRKPLLLIGPEDGTNSVHNVDGVDFVPIYESSELSTLVAGVANGMSSKCRPGVPYTTVVLDAATSLQDMILKEILGLKEIPVQKSWGMASRDQYSQAGIQTKERIRGLLDLASTGIDVTVIAQERNFTEEEQHDILMPFIGAALFPSVTAWLNYNCDYVVQTFIRQAFETKIIKVGNKETTQKIPKQGVEFCIRTAPDPVFMTKFRVPKGQPLPEVVVDPSYDKIMKIIKGVKDAGAVKKS